jgi:hypothetical protein
MFDYTKTVVGLDVHKESIVAAVLPPDSDRVALTTKFENTPVALKTFVERLHMAPSGYFRIAASTVTPFGRWENDGPEFTSQALDEWTHRRLTSAPDSS